MDPKALEGLGIAGAEVQVYLALLKLGQSPLNKVVRETSLQKSTVYNSATRLQEKGLVSNVIRDSRRYFEAVEPERLIEFLHERKKRVDECEEELKELMSRIKKSADPSKPAVEAHVFVGLEGFKTMRRDVLKNSGGELLMLGAIGKEWKLMPAFYKNWNKSRLVKGIHVRILYKKSLEKVRKEANKMDMIGKFDARILPEELESPAVINVYGDRVANIVWRNDYPICFLMINRETANAYRKYFEYLWKRAKD